MKQRLVYHPACIFPLNIQEISKICSLPFLNSKKKKKEEEEEEKKRKKKQKEKEENSITFFFLRGFSSLGTLDSIS